MGFKKRRQKRQAHLITITAFYLRFRHKNAMEEFITPHVDGKMISTSRNNLPGRNSNSSLCRYFPSFLYLVRYMYLISLKGDRGSKELAEFDSRGIGVGRLRLRRGSRWGLGDRGVKVKRLGDSGWGIGRLRVVKHGEVHKSPHPEVSTFALTAAAAREAAAALAMFSSLMVFDLSPFSVSLSASVASSIFTRR